MRFLRRYSAALLFVAVLIFCAIKVIGQFQANQIRHVELREDFLHLYHKSHTEEAEHYLQSLIFQIPTLPDQTLVEDLQRAQSAIQSLKLTNKLSSEDQLNRFRFHLTEQIDKRAAKRLEGVIKETGENQ